MIVSAGSNVFARSRLAARPRAFRGWMGVSLSLLMVAMFSSVTIQNVARAMELVKPEAAPENRIQALIPDIEAYIANGMSAFDVPGLAIGIVAGDKLVYAKGFGLRSKGGVSRSIRAQSSRSARPPRRFSLQRWPSWSIDASCAGTTELSILIRIFS